MKSGCAESPEREQERRSMLMVCITKQLKQMDIKDLREAYTAICKISDRGKDTTPM